MMLGYLSSDLPGVLEPPHDGWHDSGDVVEIDADGYVAIRGRVKRFAKIAGEMVSLNAVEAMIAELWPEDSHAVVAVPDPRRGERVVLLTTRNAARKGEVAAYRPHPRRQRADGAERGDHHRAGAAARLRQDRPCRRPQTSLRADVGLKGGLTIPHA